MWKGQSFFITISGLSAALVIIFLVLRISVISSYRKQIPQPPASQNLPAMLKQQLDDGYKSAYHHPSSENLGTLGMIYNSSAYYEEAARCYNLAIRKDETNWKCSYYLGYLKQEMGDIPGAISNYRRVIRINPKAFLALYYEGECYQKSGSADSAEIAYMRIIENKDTYNLVRTPECYDYFPLVTYSMYNLARIYMDRGQAGESEKKLKEIINSQKAFGPAYRLLGNIYSTRGNDSISKHYLLRANDLTVNPVPVDTLIDRLSMISRSDLYLLKKIDEAEMNIYPEYALTLVSHGLKYIPDNIYLISKAINLYLVRDMGQKALPFLERHLAFFTNDYIELKSVGDLLYQKGFYNQAIRYYTRAIDLEPGDTKAQVCMIICKDKEHKRGEALKMIEDMLASHLSDPSVIADCITLYYSMGDSRDAGIWLNRLKRIAPSFPRQYQLSGMMAEQSGHISEALDLYEAANRGDPSDMRNIQLYGNLLLRMKKWRDAIKLYRNSLVRYPNDPYLLERLGTLLVTCEDTSLRDLREGRDLSERAFINKSSHSITLVSAGRSLAIAYAMSGESQKATKIIESTISIAHQSNLPEGYSIDLQNILKHLTR